MTVVTQVAAGPQLASKHLAAAPQRGAARKLLAAGCGRAHQPHRKSSAPFYDNQDISPDALSEEEPLDVALAEESYSRRRLLAEELKAP